MGIMEIVKKGFGIVHKNIKLLILLFVFNLIGNTIRLPFTPATPAPGEAPSPALVGLSLLLAIVGVFMFGGVIGSIKEFIQTQKGTLANFVKYGVKYYLRILGVWVLVALIVLVFALLVAIGISIGVAVKNLVGVVLALAVVLIAGGIGIYIFILLLLSPYIVVADDTGPIAAMKKSVNFVRKSLLKIIGLFAILILISIGIGFVIGVTIGLLSFILKGMAGRVIITIVGSAFNAYINVLLPSCFLLYYMTSSKVQAAPPTAAPEGPKTA